MNQVRIAIFCAVVLGLASVGEVFAQQDSRIERTRLPEDVLQAERRLILNEENPNIEVEEAPESPGDNDIGEQLLLKEKKTYKTFAVFADTTGSWTDNVALAKRGKNSDRFMVGTVGVSALPQMTPTLLGEVTVKNQWYRYDTYNILDFNSFNAGGGLTYIFQELDGTAVYGRYNFNSLSDGDHGDEFYKNHTLTFGIFKAYSLSKAHYLFTSWSSQVSMTDPAGSQRDDHGFTLGYHADLTRSLGLDASARFGYAPYDFGGREDISETVAMGLSYKLIDELTLSASWSQTFNQSNQPIYNYEVMNVGVTLAGKLSF